MINSLVVLAAEGTTETSEHNPIFPIWQDAARCSFRLHQNSPLLRERS